MDSSRLIMAQKQFLDLKLQTQKLGIDSSWLILNDHLISWTVTRFERNLGVEDKYKAMNFMACGIQADAYKDTGCYNLECAGFVQTSNSWVIGGTMGAYTTLSSDANFEYNMGVLVIYVSQTSLGPCKLFQIQGHILFKPTSMHANYLGPVQSCPLHPCL